MLHDRTLGLRKDTKGNVKSVVFSATMLDAVLNSLNH